MTRARRELVDIDTTPYYHCICRCVRRAFLCGEDSFTGKSYEHRKAWVLERLRALQDVFAVDICAYAVMSNHYHLVVRLNRGQAEGWSDAEVMARWSRLFTLPLLIGRYRDGQTTSKAENDQARTLLAEWRKRLADLSWFMRSLNEYLARRANEEDGCKGRFWEGRFKSQALLDEAAVLTCMSYVDLNPIRAGIAPTPEASDFTSIQQRIRELSDRSRAEAGGAESPRLVPLEGKTRSEHPNAFSFSTQDYLALVDWVGRAIREDKRGAIASTQPPILTRLGVNPEQYVRHVQRGGRANHCVALGDLNMLRTVAHRLGRKFLKGTGQANRLYVQRAS